MSEAASEEIALQSSAILQTFVLNGADLAPTIQTSVKSLRTLQRHVVVSFEHITLKLGNFIDF